MKQCLISKNSDTLLIFFTGWGCDEYEFEHLKSDCDVLLLYDYTNLNLDFDFSKYKNFDLIAFSAGVFTASIFKFDFEINKKIAISGNPYLFDEHLGLSSEIQNILYNINEENADYFARNYLIKTDDEWENFRHSKRTFESCRVEFDSLKEIYKANKQNVKDIFDFAIIGDNDKIFNLSAQKEFYGEKLFIAQNAGHNLFFRLENYEELFERIKSWQEKIYC
ncbi:DUF452 family protein [bacterium]|nr:DUF452 family protein [bacterium]